MRRAAGELAKGVDVDVLAGVVLTTLFGIAIKALDKTSRAKPEKIADHMMQSCLAGKRGEWLRQKASCHSRCAVWCLLIHGTSPIFN